MSLLNIFFLSTLFIWHFFTIIAFQKLSPLLFVCCFFFTFRCGCSEFFVFWFLFLFFFFSKFPPFLCVCLDLMGPRLREDWIDCQNCSTLYRLWLFEFIIRLNSIRTQSVKTIQIKAIIECTTYFVCDLRTYVRSYVTFNDQQMFAIGRANPPIHPLKFVHLSYLVVRSIGNHRSLNR